MKRNNLRVAAFNNEIQISSLFDSNTDLAVMRVPYGKKFLKTYEAAFNDYVKGNWESAQKGFDLMLEMKPNDGPCMIHINHMKANNNTPPVGWEGHKPFDE